jgi:hypothetical protein
MGAMWITGNSQKKEMAPISWGNYEVFIPKYEKWEPCVSG